MKRWRLPLVIGCVALVALAAAFGVSRASAATTMHRASATAEGGSTGCDRLMNDPAAAKAMQPLHAERVQDMQAWRDKYGASPTSAEARTALKNLRREHAREMRKAFRKLGIKVRAGTCDANTMGRAGMMDGSAGMMDGSAAGGDLHQQHHGGDAGSSSGASNMMGGSSGGMMGGATY